MKLKKAAVVALVVIAALSLLSLLRWKRRKDQEDAAFNDMVDLLNSHVGSDWHWMLPAVNEVMEGKTAIDNAYLVDGKVTKPGALLAIYASSFYPNQTSRSQISGDPEQFHKLMYSIFYDLQAQRQLGKLM